METAHELFIHELTDMLGAEKQLVDALTKQEELATRPELKKAFASHKAQTEKQVQRLEQVFESIGEEAEEKECKGVAGLVEEFESFVEEEEPSSDILDVVAIGAAKKVETYEINAYNSLIELAESMGHDKATKLLNQNLKEEEATLQKLETLGEKIKPEDLGMEEDEDAEMESEEEIELEDEAEEVSTPRKSSPQKKGGKRRAA